MVAGIGSIDLALLVVAADDGWMPQTEEHLQILTYLGVTRGVVALTKIDLAASEADAVAARAGTAARLAAGGVGDRADFGRARPAAARVGGTEGRPRRRSWPARRRSATSASRGCRWTGRSSSRASAPSSPARSPAARSRAGKRRSFSRRAGRRGCATCRRTTATWSRAAPGSRVALNLPDLAAGAGHAARAAATDAAVGRGDVVTLAALGGPSRHVGRAAGAVRPRRSTTRRRPSRRRTAPSSTSTTAAATSPPGSTCSTRRTCRRARRPWRRFGSSRRCSPSPATGSSSATGRPATRWPAALCSTPTPAATTSASDARRAFLQARADAPDRAGGVRRLASRAGRARPAAGGASAQVAASPPTKSPPPSRRWRPAGKLVAAGGLLIDPARWQGLRRRAAEAVDAWHAAAPGAAGAEADGPAASGRGGPARPAPAGAAGTRPDRPTPPPCSTRWWPTCAGAGLRPRRRRPAARVPPPGPAAAPAGRGGAATGRVGGQAVRAAGPQGVGPRARRRTRR